MVARLLLVSAGLQVMIFASDAATLDDLLRLALEGIRDQGQRIDPTRGAALELLGASLELGNPRARLSRSETRGRAVSAIAELCWYLGGSNDGAQIAFYISKYEAEIEADGTVNGGYGPRLFPHGGPNQIESVVNTLKVSRCSRRAVVQLFDRSDIGGTQRFKDVPCTCTLQFIIRDEQLILIVNMRSNDVYLGLPHDIFAFTMLQEIVARDLQIEPGRYIHVAGSLHLYDKHASSAARFVDEGWQSTTSPMPPMPPGSQWANINDLLNAERQVRAGVPYAHLDLPHSPYWADLARLLAMFAARKRGEIDESRAVGEHISNERFRIFHD